MKRKAVARAAEFASVANKVGGVFVFASRDANLPKQENASATIASHQFAAHKCKTCASVFDHIRGKGYQPFCVTCGSEDVDIGEDTNPIIPDDEDLAAVVCSACNTVHAFKSEVASLGHVHCASCGHKMQTMATLDGTDDLPAVPTNTDSGDADDLELLDIDGDGEESDVFGDSTDDTEQHDDLQAPVPTDTEISDNVDDVANNDYSGESLEVDLVDQAQEDETPIEELSFSYAGQRVNVIAGVKVIATLEQAAAGDNADILQTEAFRIAVARTIETDGLKKALAHYKFTPVTIKVPLSKVVKARVEARVSAQTASAKANQGEYVAAFQQSLDIAAAGLASNYWRGRQDPVKAALIAELSSLGIRSAAKIVDKVFAAHGVAQQREVLTIARELAGKPVEILNSLAETIDLVRYTPTGARAQASTEDDDADVTDGEDEEEEEDDGEEATFAAVATPVVPVRAETASPGGSHRYHSPELRAIAGSGPLFGR